MAYQTVNPANNQLIKTYPAHSDADVEAALQQADALYHSAWAKGDIEPRLAVLHKLADLIDSRAEELAKIASQEMGKLIKQSRGEVKLCAQIARYYADNAKSFLAPVKYPSELGEAWVEHHPIGVLLAVEPWNFPYYQLIRVLAPNLAAGNPVIAKHASIVPHCAETFAHLVREAGAPEGRGPTCLSPRIRWRRLSPTIACRARRSPGRRKPAAWWRRRRRSILRNQRWNWAAMMCLSCWTMPTWSAR